MPARFANSSLIHSPLAHDFHRETGISMDHQGASTHRTDLYEWRAWPGRRRRVGSAPIQVVGFTLKPAPRPPPRRWFYDLAMGSPPTTPVCVARSRRSMACSSCADPPRVRARGPPYLAHGG